MVLFVEVKHFKHASQVIAVLWESHQFVFLVVIKLRKSVENEDIDAKTNQK